MKSLIHDLVTSVKYLYPCFAHGEPSSDKELVIETETNVSRIYPIKKRVQGMESVGEDYWGRYTFKDKNDQYYCEIDGVLYFKGNDMDGEPNYPVKEVIHYESPEIDADISEFKPQYEKAIQFFTNHKDVELIESRMEIKQGKDIRDSKIVCVFKLKVK